MPKNINLKVLIIATVLCQSLFSQIELVPISHPAYQFLKRMQLSGILKDYNSSIIPISRSEVASYIKRIDNSDILSNTDKKILEDLKIEFEYELINSLKSSSSLIDKFEGKSIFGNKTQKYIYYYSDSNATLFFNFIGDLNWKSKNSDLNDNSILLGDLGLNVRGSLFNRIGYSIGYLGGKKLYGNESDKIFALENDPILKTNPKFIYENNYFDFYNGHFRYQTNNNWLSLTFGREALNLGFGYVDKLFLSNNSAPFDFLNLDMRYKKIRYAFIYGSIKGDSLGIDLLKSKNIAIHKLNIDFSDLFKVGFFESVIMSNNPFSFVYFNPISFITSADLNTGAKETKKNNTLMGFDVEINPIRNFSFQGSLLIDDINFSTMFKSDSSSNDNKFGYQVGTMWTNAFSLQNLTFILEYTRLNPFVYSHRSNKDTYTNWNLSLGHLLPPNSDEIALKLIYDISNRLKINFLYQFQRSAQGIYYDSIAKKIINYGGNINRGDGDYSFNNRFLLGDRINRNLFTASLSFEPIKQYFLEIQFKYIKNNLLYLSREDSDLYFYTNLKVKL